MKKKFVKVTAVTAIAALLVTGAVHINNNTLSQVMASSNTVTNETKQENDKAIQSVLNGIFAKDETVYAFCGADGSVSNIIVSDWLKNGEGNESLADASDLSDIVNVKGDETFTVASDGSLTWNTSGTDIYYQGTTTKELPVSIKVTYLLDGEEITPEDLLHKSGKVTIRYEYTNNELQTVKEDGKSYDVYVPFVMATGMILPNDQFRNVEVNQGKIFSDGSRNIVLGYAVPGLDESLNLNKDEKTSSLLTNTVEITADVEDFTLGMTITVATSELLSDLDVSEIEDIDSINDLINKISDASEQLVSGSGTLYDGLVTLQGKMGELSSGVSTLADGGSQIASGAATLDDNMKTLVDGLASSKAGVSTIVAGYEGDNGAVNAAKTIAGGLSKVSAGTESLAAGVNSMAQSMQQTIESYTAQVKEIKTAQAKLVAAGSDLTSEQYEQLGQLEGAIAALSQIVSQMNEAGLSENIATLNTAAGALKNGSEQLSAGLTKLYEGTKTLQAGITKLSAGSTSLKEGTQKLRAAANTLKQGTASLSSAVTQLSQGVDTLTDGGKELKEGMETFHQDAVLKVIDTFNGDIKDLINRLDAVVSAGKSYESFTDIADDCEGSVKFIIKTSEIE